MNPRSLVASQKGIEAANMALKRACLTQGALAKDLQISRATVSKFFNGKNVDRSLFIDSICHRLDLDWNEIVQRPEYPKSTDLELTSEDEQLQNNEQSEIDDLVVRVKRKRHESIQAQYGIMRVLDMTQPVGIDEIYTSVNILEKITSRRRLDLDELQKHCDQASFDRFGLGRIFEKGVLGTKAVEKYSKLMVLGKPGAGKTTFLKYLTIRCNLNELQSDRVPIFVTLKDFAEAENILNSNALNNGGEYQDLLCYISSQFIKHDISYEQLEKLLKNGRALILLDGLDEVRDEDSKRIIKEIQDFSDQFKNNCYVITCRIAAKEYIFERFTEVEIADFDKKQIRTFAKKWFQVKDPEKIEKFIKKLEVNKPIQELATSPLLLTLLCLVFGEKADFPSNRSELYKEGLDILLKKWDAKRNIERNLIYEQLSLQRKEDLLGQIARLTFERGDYFFKQAELEHYIAEYIRNLPEAQLDPVALRIDSENILKSIESQHGLLIERARGIYSFSHLTFHEYFTAREIVFGLQPLEQALNNLNSHLRESRWREVFLLSIGMLRNADYLLVKMKQSIDDIVKNDRDLQIFLNRINQKSCDITRKIKSFYKPAAIRAFYLAVDLARASSIERATKNIIYCAKSIATNLIFEMTVDSALESIKEIVVEIDLDFGSTISPDRTLAFAIDDELTVNSKGELIFNEANEESSSIHLLEEAQEKLGVLEEIYSRVSEIEENYIDFISQTEELKEKCEVLILEAEEIEKKKSETRKCELVDPEEQTKTINNELEKNYEQINYCKEKIELLDQDIWDLIYDSDINLSNQEAIGFLRSRIFSDIQAVKKRVVELEKQKFKNEFKPDFLFNSALSELLQELKEQLPSSDVLEETFEDWWENQGSIWSEQLREKVCRIMIDSVDLGHDWQFNHSQMELLKDYYDSNKLLIDCLNSDCYATRSVRDEIEATLLLPIVEIERRKSFEN